ncbi:MAG: TonB-dependent receptor [Fusobacterium perfoetens]|uniref:TonB-dependent receptor n=1 Tax=Fusobacterium perfoetens TaxID=852 RepID=UPI0023F30B6C|nr:TonB-dependent receptor [Fusobacterium perfoetens]MCI6153152.1 TonB-dependent receptor [Fusobacterium perfoetens]MDY3237082.1 TonB-dependent receptor [Fusobacterium perfoetens]
MKRVVLFYCILNSLIMAQDIQLGQSIISPDYIEVEKLKPTKNVIVIDKEHIQEKGYTSVSQVLNDIPGITVGTSAWGEIDIRGQGADQAAKNIQVMVDGAPITTLTTHPYQTNYDVIPIEQIEKIEIIPGGGSVLYGNGTSGGVINITTNLKTMNKPINKIGYEFTKDKEKKYYTNFGTKINDNLAIQLNYSKSDKDWYFIDTYSNTEYFSGGFNFKISNNQALTFKYSHFEEDGQFIKNISKSNLEEFGENYRPKYSNVTVGIDENGLKIQEKKRRYLSSDREDDTFKLSYVYQITDDFLFTIDGFSSKGYFTNNEDADNKKMEQETLGTKTKLNISYGNENSLLIGTDYFKQTANMNYFDYKLKKVSEGDTPIGNQYIDGDYIKYDGKNTYKKVPYNFNYERFVKAIYFLNSNKFGDFEFTQGARYDITDWSFDKNANDGKGKDKSHRVNQNYEVSAAYNYRDTGKIYARYERGFTGPDGIQISDKRLDENGNSIYVKTEAEDEIFDMYEIGLRDYILGSAINLTGFYTKTDNQMNRVYLNNSPKESITVNYLETERYGVEFTANQVFGKLSFEEGYTYLKGKSNYNSQGKANIGKVDWSNSGLKKVPKHMISIKADYNIIDNLTTGLIWKYTGGYNNYLKDIERDEDSLVKSHVVVDFSLRYNNPKGYSIYSGINNLFNEKYYGYVGDNFSTVIPEFGRTYYLGASYTF